MLRTDSQTIFADYFRDFRDRSGRFETKIANNHESFVHQNTRPIFQFRQRNPWIDIAIIIGPADDDMGCVLRSRAEKSADAIRRRGHLFHDLFKFLDHLPRFPDHLFVLGNVRAKIEQFAAGLSGGKQSDDAVERIEKSPTP